MPSIDDNKHTWDGDYQWELAGDEWSLGWGGASMQWFGTILPRIHPFLEGGRILEIAPGYGRWTNFLKDHTDNLVLVDLSQECIEACKKRFAGVEGISYHINDGRSLDMIESNSMDFIFSFDSLVHVEDQIIEEYVSQIAEKLTDNGVAFIHHSNFGEYQLQRKLFNRPILGKVLGSLGFLEKTYHGRAKTMTAEEMRRYASNAGLSCVAQEVLPWATKRAKIDCFSILVKPGSRWDRSPVILENPYFNDEAANLKNLSKLYSFTDKKSGDQ